MFFASNVDPNLAIIERLRQNKLTIYWVRNAILSLGLAGIYSIILVLLRTPQLNNLFSNPTIFRSALVVHVNLSVLIWLLSITAAIWSNNFKSTLFSTIYLIVAAIGTILIAISPLCGQHSAIMNNYIPILENIIFIFGLSLFSVAILLFAVNILYEQFLYRKMSLTTLTSVLIFLGVWGCFIYSYYQLQELTKIVPIDIEFYYELLFWSGGHLLQFLYTQILMVIWILLLEAALDKKPKFQRPYTLLLILNFAISLGAIAGHFLYDIVDSEFKDYYTNQMRYGGGIAPVLCLLLIIYEIFIGRKPIFLVVKTTIICSSSLFLFGGVIGILISNMNVTVPAHYHGAIVGISVAFMGFVYLVITTDRQQCSKFCYAIYILTIGQILHITGLLLAGGYDVLRKAPEAKLAHSAKLFMGIMGIGGLAAIAGGLMFVWLCVNASLKNKFK